MAVKNCTIFKCLSILWSISSTNYSSGCHPCPWQRGTSRSLATQISLGLFYFAFRKDQHHDIIPHQQSFNCPFWGSHRGGTPQFPALIPKPGPVLCSGCCRFWVQFHGFPGSLGLTAALSTLQLLCSGVCGTQEGTVQSSGLKGTTEPLQLCCSHPAPTEMSELWSGIKLTQKCRGAAGLCLSTITCLSDHFSTSTSPTLSTLGSEKEAEKHQPGELLFPSGGSLLWMKEFPWAKSCLPEQPDYFCPELLVNLSDKQQAQEAATPHDCKDVLFFICK